MQFPGVLGLLGLLAWTAAEAVGASWAQLRQRPDLAAELAAAQQGVGGLLSQLLDAEASLDAASLALVRHILPLLPFALLGLLLREGRELVSAAPPPPKRPPLPRTLLPPARSAPALPCCRACSLFP